MTNVDAPFGLRPVKHLWGAPWNGATVLMKVLSSYNTALYVGDPVLWQGSDGGGRNVIQIFTAGATNKITGVITGFKPDPDNLSCVYGKAATTRWAYVCVDPSVVYEVQDDGTAVLGNDIVGSNANLVTTHSGSTYTGLSGVELNASSVGADATYQVTIVDSAQREDNDTTIARARWYVTINLPSIFPGIAGLAH